ncbi:zinc finger protein 862-like [Ptychodera flava]|uniref:zinc finger protein 862-like n=1 Tax=Ptychodera flava TaxID=63121 RepID=UPI00396A47A7
MYSVFSSLKMALVSSTSGTGSAKKKRKSTILDYCTSVTPRSTDSIASASEDEREESTSIGDGRKTSLKFQNSWLAVYGSWLRHDTDRGEMFCSLCRDMQFKNAMAVGTKNMKTTTIKRHLKSVEHKQAIAAPCEAACMEAAVRQQLSREEDGIQSCLKVVYWLAKETIPLTKYPSLMGLLRELGTPNLDVIQCGQRVTYSSYNTACDMLNSISNTIDRDVTQKLRMSPTISILTDESTDIAVHHKLTVNARVIDPLSMVPMTLFLTDIHITAADGSGIFTAIKDHLAKRNIPLCKITGLGTDGASVMTGRKKGLTGQFLQVNPQLVNTHCSAHRVALCSEQAATKIPAMKFYQEVLESLFYYFKKSPKRCESVKAVQDLLNEPALKYREVSNTKLKQIPRTFVN